MERRETTLLDMNAKMSILTQKVESLAHNMDQFTTKLEKVGEDVVVLKTQQASAEKRSGDTHWSIGAVMQLLAVLIALAALVVAMTLKK